MTRKRKLGEDENGVTEARYDPSRSGNTHLDEMKRSVDECVAL
jgi:hypothetical protein